MFTLIVKIFVGCAGVLGLVFLISGTDVHLPGDHTGFSPEQPIAYSHALHAGELGIDCLYCHYGARSSPVAGIPPASVCMNCHKAVTARWDDVLQEKALAKQEGREPRRIISPELRKLYDALGLDDNLEPRPGVEPRPIQWVRVHDLPDYVAFDHRVHVARGVECQTCHGPVETMERIRQESSLSMGWCIECHRINSPQGEGALPPGLGHPRVNPHVTTDCAACHY